MVLFIRDNECFEPRVRNYLRYFERHGIPYHVIAWNRNGTAQPNKNITFFERRAEYGKRLANIPNKLLWMLFVMRKIIRHRHEYSMIHACDIDAVLPALIVGKIMNKTIVFDVFDWISSLTGRGVIYKIVDFLQNVCYKYSDAVILCEEERKAQANTKNDHVLIIPNIPDGKVAFDSQTMEKCAADLTEYDYVISYVGVFDRDRGLENLLEAVSKCPRVKLNIAGFGVLDELICGYANKHSNIAYWGRVEYSVGQAIQKNSSMIAAMYHLTSPLHKYAAPNKYYESLYLGVPMITTKNTLVGSKVQKYDTGFVLDEHAESLLELFEKEDLKAQIDDKVCRCKDTWDKVYKNYYEDYMSDHYVNLVKRIDL